MILWLAKQKPNIYNGDPKGSNNACSAGSGFN